MNTTPNVPAPSVSPTFIHDKVRIPRGLSRLLLDFALMRSLLKLQPIIQELKRTEMRFSFSRVSIGTTICNFSRCGLPRLFPHQRLFPISRTLPPQITSIRVISHTCLQSLQIRIYPRLCSIPFLSLIGCIMVICL